MSRLLETAEILKQLNQLWDEHAKHINKANTSLKAMLNTASSSTYISTLKSIADAQDAITRSTTKLNSATKSHAATMQNMITQRAATLAANKQLASSIGDLEKKLSKANKELANMKSNSASATTALNTQANTITQLTSKVAALEGKLNQANGAVNKIGKSASFSLGPLTSLIGAFGISTGVYLFAEVVKNIYETTKELQSLDLALKMVSETEEQYARNKVYVTSVSEKWGLEIKSLTQQYIQFYTASKGLLDNNKIEQTFEGIAKAGAVMGLSLEKQSAAFYAIDQMMSKGTVSSEELKKQLGNAMPGAIKAAAMAFMQLHPQIKTIAEAEKELYAAMKKGAVDSATYVPLIVENFQKLYGIENLNRVDTLISKQNRLSNSWTEMVRHMNESDGNGIALFFGNLITWANRAIVAIDKLNMTIGQLTKGARDKGDSAEFDLMSQDIKTLSPEQIDDAISDYKYKIEKAKEEIAKINKLNASTDMVDIFTFNSRRSDMEKWFEYLGRAEGGLKAINAYLHPVKAKPVDITGGGEDEEDKKRRERVKLNFDWLKSEYELKKAIIERQRAEYSHDMNDEASTLAKRMEARVKFSEKSMELLKLEADEQKAMNSEKYLNDMERNRVALANKDITQKKYAQNTLDLNKRLHNEQLKADETYKQKWQEILYSNLEFYKKINDKRLEYQKRTSKAEINYYKQTLQETISSKSASDSEIIQALQDLRKTEYNEAVKERDRQLKLAGDEADLKAAIWAEYGKNIQDIDKRMNDGLEANRQRRIQREMEIANMQREAYGHDVKSPYGGKDEHVQGFLESSSEDVKAQYEELLNNYKIAVASGEEDIIAERKRQLDEFVDYVKSVNEYASEFFKDFVDSSGMKTLFDVLGGKIKGFGDDWKTTFLAITEMAQEFVAIMNQNSQAQFDAERARLEDRYKYERELAGENEAAQADVDRQYEQRKRDIANREAKAKRDMALFNIAINTAQAIIGLWVNPGFPAAIPMAIAVGALGAIQMAMVASRPLPQYYRGTENSPEGFAWVDEEGPEIHTDKSGNIKDLGSNKGPRIKYLNQGDKIIPAKRSANMLNQDSVLRQLDDILFGNNISYNNNNINQLDDAGIIDSINSLKQTLLEKESYEEHYDARGYTKWTKKNGQKIEEKSNRIRFKKR